MPFTSDDWHEIERIQHKRTRTQHERIIHQLAKQRNEHQRQIVYMGSLLLSLYDDTVADAKKAMEGARDWQSYIRRAMKHYYKAL